MTMTRQIFDFGDESLKQTSVVKKLAFAEFTDMHQDFAWLI